MVSPKYRISSGKSLPSLVSTSNYLLTSPRIILIFRVPDIAMTVWVPPGLGICFARYGHPVPDGKTFGKRVVEFPPQYIYLYIYTSRNKKKDHTFHPLSYPKYTPPTAYGRRRRRLLMRPDSLTRATILNSCVYDDARGGEVRATRVYDARKHRPVFTHAEELHTNLI